MRDADPLEALEGRIDSYGAGRAVVAFSGGVDSSVVLAATARVLGAGRTVAVTAVSPSYPDGELESARTVAAALGVEHRTVETHEVEREAYARNDGLRCFHCKTELFSTLERVAELGIGAGATVLSGANADDVTDVRPGIRAGRRFGVRSPLLEEGLGKREVRTIARALGLGTAEKPAMACLSSRVAFGIRITPELLERIDLAERAIRALGFEQVRVRHFGDRASVEVAAEDVARLMARMPEVADRVRGLGWERVEADPEGYRSGSMNATLVQIGGRRASVRFAGNEAGSTSAPPG